MNNLTKITVKSAEETPVETGRIKRPIAVGSELYNRVSAFLYEEAWLLDHDQFDDWFKLLGEDLVYTAPVRVTRSRKRDERGLTGRTGYHYYDTYETMAVRVRRILHTSSAWSDDPPLRCQRFITNVMAGITETAGEYHVRSYIKVARSRFEVPDYQWIAAERNDVLREAGDSFKIARRSILVGTSVLGTPNLGIFL